MLTEAVNRDSQCSTVVRNTVVRATIKVNGKHPILGTRRPQTLWPIDLKFDVGNELRPKRPQTKTAKTTTATTKSIHQNGEHEFCEQMHVLTLYKVGTIRSDTESTPKCVSKKMPHTTGWPKKFGTIFFCTPELYQILTDFHIFSLPESEENL